MAEIDDFKQAIQLSIQQQRNYFASSKTRNVDSRIQTLKLLASSIKKHEEEILQALQKDLNKSPQEGYMTEVSMILAEIRYHIRHLKKWAKPHKVSTPIYLLPSKSYKYFEPLGVVLILSPWNYPFQLLLSPLVGAISAGNCAILKPSSSSPNINLAIKTVITEVFPEDYVMMVDADREETLALLSEKFDFIFFTGSPKFGKEVMQCAAQNLTPLVLELGGKSPCIIDKESKINIAARRVVWGKLLNAGQTCIAPDYFFVHKSLEQPFIEALIQNIKEMYGDDLKTCPYYPRIINDSAMARLKTYLQDGKIEWGGDTDDTIRYFEPTILSGVSTDSDIMQTEIFGPIFPIMTFEDIEEVVTFVNSRPKPLAFYYFGESSKGWALIHRTSSGGACVNDVVIHQVNDNLPFGGVGNSGMGKYHGRYSFEAFSNERSIVHSATWIDIVLKYPPFKYFSIVKKVM